MRILLMWSPSLSKAWNCFALAKPTWKVDYMPFMVPYQSLEGKSWIRGDLPQLFPQLSIMSGVASIAYLSHRNRPFIAFGMASLFGLGSGFLLFPSWRQATANKVEPAIPDKVTELHRLYLTEYRRALLEISDGWERAESSIKRIRFPKII
jgi:hypothetical protein